MASSEEGKRKRDGVSKCYPHNLSDALHISVKELSGFVADFQPGNLHGSKWPDVAQQSVFSLALVRYSFPDWGVEWIHDAP